MRSSSRTSHFVLTLVASVVLSVIATAWWISHHPPQVAQTTDPVYQHVIDSGILRCGYVIYPPGLMKDPNTGKLSGIFVDTIEKAGANLGLKVEWTEEVGWGTMIEGLKADRYDLICSPVWANSPRAKQALFTIPLFYSGIGVYVRTGDNRFQGNISAIDKPSVRIATIDGEEGDTIAQEQFPQAERVSLPQLTDVSQELLEVQDKKADVAFVEPYIADLYLANHPGALVNLVPGKPIRVFPNTMMLANSAPKLQAMVNTALSELVNSGYVDELFKKYSIEPGALFPDALPYRTTQ